MTPEREAYLVEHTGREAIIRHLIKGYKHELKKYKAVCSSYDLKAQGRKLLGYRIHIVRVNETKLLLNALRHELARLKGMDRVVVPRGVDRAGFWQAQSGECSCGNEVVRADGRYCSCCGRRILWEKVK